MSMLKRQNKLAALLSAFDAQYIGNGAWKLPGKDGYFFEESEYNEAHCFVGGFGEAHGMDRSDDGTVEGLARWWIKQQLAA